MEVESPLVSPPRSGTVAAAGAERCSAGMLGDALGSWRFDPAGRRAPPGAVVARELPLTTMRDALRCWALRMRWKASGSGREKYSPAMICFMLRERCGQIK